MADESKADDPYEAALADLYERRDQLNQAIATLEALRGAGTGAAPAPQMRGARSSLAMEDAHGSLLGMSIVEAAKKLLSQHRRPLKNPEFAQMFKQGGLHLNSKDWTNTIGAVLSRRSADIGDVVKVQKGTFGLKEWYPNRSFKKGGDKSNAEDSAD